MKIIDKDVKLQHNQNYRLDGAFLLLLHWGKFSGFIPEFRILRLTFHSKSASKCCIKIPSLLLSIYVTTIDHLSLKLFTLKFSELFLNSGF